MENLEITAVFEKVDEGYIAYIPEIEGVNTQGETLEETKSNLWEALDMVLSTRLEIAKGEIEGKTVIQEKVKILV